MAACLPSLQHDSANIACRSMLFVVLILPCNTHSSARCNFVAGSCCFYLNSPIHVLGVAACCGTSWRVVACCGVLWLVVECWTCGML